MNFHQLIEKYTEPKYQVLIEQIVAKANLNPSSAKLEQFITESIENFIENTPEVPPTPEGEAV